ncbi:MAG: Virginiamycin B lyase [Ktedonobacterales bacterium]
MRRIRLGSAQCAARERRGTWGPRLIAGALLGALALTLLGCAPLGQRTGNTGRFPGKLVVGADGALWFAEGPTGSVRVGRITTAGKVTEVSIAPGAAETLTVAPNGTLWFAEGNSNPRVGSLTSQGVVTIYHLTPQSHPRDLAASPDGNLWYTDAQNNAIARVTPSGDVRVFPLPTPDAAPWKIVADPGGRLWFTEDAVRQIGSITESGTITEYPVPSADMPDGIGTGPDNSIWFTEINSSVGGGAVWRRAADGTLTQFPIVLNHGTSNVSNPDAITEGPDGNLWFSALGAGVGRITPTGQITVFPLTKLQATGDITAGPDGNLWFSAVYTNKIVRITPAGQVTTFDLPADHYTCGWFSC